MTDITATIQLSNAAARTLLFPNAGGAGYYRFVLDRASQQALLEKAVSLPDREALALADSVSAAFAAGQQSFETVLQAAAALARHPNRTVVTKLAYFLTDLQDSLVDESLREALAQRLREIYGPRLRALGYDVRTRAYAKESAERALLRRALASIVVLWARDGEVRKAFSEAARGSLNDPALLDAGIRSRVWAVGVQTDGPGFGDAMVKHLFESRDPQIRLDAAYALGHAEQPDVAARARSLLLDPKLGPDLTFEILDDQMRSPVTRSATWTWFTEKGEQLIAKLPAIYQPWLPRVFDRFCQAERRDALETFLGRALTKAGVDALPLQRAVERINLCIALMTRHEQDMKSALVDDGTAARRP